MRTSLLLLLLLVCSPARADEPERTLSLESGQPAPFSGLLLTDLRFAELKTAELELAGTEIKLQQERTAYEDMKVVANACIEELEEGGPWYTSFWAGAAAGIGTAVLVGWLGLEVGWW